MNMLGWALSVRDMEKHILPKMETWVALKSVNVYCHLKHERVTVGLSQHSRG